MKVDDVPTMANHMGWTCSGDLYNDGVACDCECGIWDPDCDPGSKSVGAINNGSLALAVLDEKHQQAVLNILDADHNGNGIIDGKEILKIQSLGISALYGVAKRILHAQENGEKQGSYHKGNWALLQAQPSASCNYLMATPPFPQGAATYEPICIKDNVWETRIGAPTGRCGLLPTMKVGSQCTVPGNGARTDRSGINGTTTSKGVCGAIMGIFPPGGTGGYFSGGVGITSAAYYHKGGTFMPEDEERADVMEKLDFSAASMTLDTTFEYGMSFYARIKADSFQKNWRIFYFGDNEEARPAYRIEVVTDGHYNKVSQGINFYIEKQEGGHWRRDHLRVDDAIRLGAEDQFMFTYKPKGNIEVWRNGIRMHFRESQRFFQGTKFAKLVIGEPALRSGHIHDFAGLIEDIRVWSRPVTWDVAVSGALPQDTPTENTKEKEGEVETTCIASRKNSWDFICGDEMPAELAEQFGYGEFSDSKATADYQKREFVG